MVNNICSDGQAQPENFKEQQGFYEHRQVLWHKTRRKNLPNSLNENRC